VTTHSPVLRATPACLEDEHVILGASDQDARRIPTFPTATTTVERTQRGTATAPHNIPLKRPIPSRISSFIIRE
jgi:hypothetical protein